MLILQDNPDSRRILRLLFEAAVRDAADDAAAGFAALRRIRCLQVRAFEATTSAWSSGEARQLAAALVKRSARSNGVELDVPDAPALVQAFDATVATTEPVPCLRLLDRRWVKGLKGALRAGICARYEVTKDKPEWIGIRVATSDRLSVHATVSYGKNVYLAKVSHLLTIDGVPSLSGISLLEWRGLATQTWITEMGDDSQDSVVQGILGAISRFETAIWPVFGSSA